MNKKMIRYIVGSIIMLEAALLLFPILTRSYMESGIRYVYLQDQPCSVLWLVRFCEVKNLKIRPFFQ